MFFKNFCISLLIFVFSINVYAVETIVVTGNRIGETEEVIPQKVLVYEEEDLKTYNAENIADFLKQINMGHIHDYPGLSTSIDIRGFRTDTHGVDLRGKVLVLINGRRAGTGNLSLIPMTNVQKIEIIRGPAGIQYGSAAMGGVVNIILKQGKEKGEFFIEGSLGSFDYKSVTVGANGKKNGFDFALALKGMDRDDYDTDMGTYPKTDIGEKSISANFGYTFNKVDRIGFVYNKFDSGDIGYNNKQQYTIDNLALYLDDYQNKKLESYDFDYTRNGEKISWNLKVFKGKEEKTYHDPDKNDFLGSNSENYYKTEFKGIQGNLFYKRALIELTTGFDYNSYETINRNSENTAPYNPDSEYSDFGLFVLPKLKLLNNKLIVTAGLRYDIYNLKIKETPLRSDVKAEETEKKPTTLSFGVKYNFSKKISLRGSYGEAYVIPQADQLNADFSVWGTPYKGNPDLDPETSKTYEVGVDYNSMLLNGYLTYFYTKYKDKIITETVSATPSYITWINSGKATIRGVEGNARFDIGGLFKLPVVVEPYLNFVYYDRFYDDTNDVKLLYVSRLQASYGIFITNNPDDFYCRLNFTYTGKQLVDDYDPATYTTTRKYKGSFTVSDLSVSKRLVNSKVAGKLYLKLDVNNLFDKDYSYVEGYPMPEKNYKGTLKYVYNF
ncbi:TonB-dependent receptor [Deferribacterales bacterium Es71-Z0220]|uniref:TonB-dependent receptor n=1 Tax=Deferrivibrio essentukiensis TaxID=2880922 RepID=UPI001F60DA9A|nr:TonB-dependent receptor [Deferrivibrio essentukiensis]